MALSADQIIGMMQKEQTSMTNLYQLTLKVRADFENALIAGDIKKADICRANLHEVMDQSLDSLQTCIMLNKKLAEL